MRDDEALSKARAFLSRAPVFDGHNDLPWVIMHDKQARGDVRAYGLDRVRFPAPVPVGSRLRGRFKLQKIEILKPLRGMQGAQLVWEVTIEREGSSKPVCVAESVSRRYG